MKFVVLFCLVLGASGVFSHMPTVYEFCSHVVANGDGGRATCDARHCQGRPGKIGPAGPRGIPGFKGDKGDQGTSEGLEEKVENLKNYVDELRNHLMKSDDIKGIMCFMGMKYHDIADAAISASSVWSNDHLVKYGRLDFETSYPPSSAWCAGRNEVGEWIQVDLGKPKTVAGLITQGRYDYEQYVRSYKVQCGNTTGTLETVQESGIDKSFVGNNDQNTKVVNKFSRPLTCRYIRVYPQTWHGHISMRMELISGECFDLY